MDVRFGQLTMHGVNNNFPGNQVSCNSESYSKLQETSRRFHKTSGRYLLIINAKAIVASAMKESSTRRRDSQIMAILMRYVLYIASSL